MKFRILLLSVFLCVNALVFSQKSNTSDDFEGEFVSRSNSLNSEIFDKARSFFFNKEWDSTLVYTSKALTKSKEDQKLADYSYFIRANSFKNKQLYKEAEKEFMKISKKFDFYDRIIVYLGEIALEQSQFDKAIKHFESIQHMDSYQMTGIQRNDIEHNLGLCYLHLKKFDKAEFYLLKTIQALELDKDTVELIGSYGDVANLYYEQYKDNLAIPYFKKAYAFSKHTKRFDLKKNTALNMAIVEENRKNFLKSLTYRKEYEQWKDSLTDQNKIYEVAQMEKQFAVKEKQKEVILLQAKNRIKIAERNGFLYSAIILLLLLITLFYSYRGKIKRNMIITAQKESLNELNTTKDKLFSIVSHDLRSSVHAIKRSNKKVTDNLESKDKGELKRLLQQNGSIVNSAYNLLDNLLNWALLQTKQAYFEITELHLSVLVDQVAYDYTPLFLEKEISFENTIPKNEIILADQESLKIIIRNLLDNAIKFSERKGTIKLYTEDKEPPYYNFIVQDYGSGIDEVTRLELLKDTVLLSKKKNEEKIGTGLGLHLVKSMVDKNKGKFSIESELGKGTRMIISLPKKE